MKKVSNLWALLVGLLTVVTQIVVFYLRFGRWNTDSSFVDFVWFFLAGALGGLILIFFLNRQPSMQKQRTAFIGFLLASPFAFIMMLGGGLMGGIGVLLLPQIPWALFTWIGSLVGKS